MKLSEIAIDGQTYQVGDAIVFNDIISFSNEFNGRIVSIQTRRNSRYPLLRVKYTLGNCTRTTTIKSYMVIRKGQDGKGVDMYYN